MKKYDVIVVGGGAAGLTTAAYTAKTGLSVALFEKQKTLGGLVQSVNRNGFIFDMGLRAIEDAGIVLPMLKELNIPIKYVKSIVSIGIEESIINITSKKSLETYKEFLKSFFPENKRDIDEILKSIKKVMKNMDVLYGVENPLFKDLKRDFPYIFKTLLPWIFKFIFTIGKINRMQEPVEKFLETLTDNRALRDIIGQHFFSQTPAFFAMSYFSVYLDYIYPEGGTASVMNLLSDFVKAQKVQINTGTMILKVDPEKQSVTDEKGDTWFYKKLVWCGNLNSLYDSINLQNISHNSVKMVIKQRKNQLKKLKGGDSVFSLFLSVDQPPEYFKKISEGHFFYSPHSKGLGDIKTRHLPQLLENYDTYTDPVEKVKEYVKEYVTLNTFEISIPVLKDSSLAPQGKTGLIVSCLFDYSLTKKVFDNGWYEKFVSFFSESIIEVLTHSVYPGLEEKILDHFAVSPVSIEHITGNEQGAITGWAFSGDTVPVPHKMQDINKTIKTPIRNIFKAGQWSYSPSGFPIAILTGKIAADKVVKELK